MAKLSVSGLSLNVITIIDIIQKATSAAQLAMPLVKDLIQAAMSVFSEEDKEKVQRAYDERMAKSDADHETVQEELAETASQAEEDVSAKGGGVQS